MKALATAALVLLAFAAAPALAAPQASFTARMIQGSVCVAPCAVHFDAIGTGRNETTDPVFTREFHSLHFQWDFGDPGSGTWSSSGVSKNSATGAIAGHLYDKPGSYSVKLTVTNPSGEAAQTTRSVTVTNPNTAFTSANTYCFANNTSNWSGCPLACSGADSARCTVTSDFDQALNDGSSCAGVGHHCGRVSQSKQRLLFRRGDTFAQSSAPALVDGAGPGLISAFGPTTSPLPRVTGSTTFLGGGDGWTISSFDADRNDGYIFDLQGSGITQNFTVYDITARGYANGCFESYRAINNTSWSRLNAVIELRCTRGAIASGANDRFLWGQYMLTMGGFSDNIGYGAFNIRVIHHRWSLIQHMMLRNPGASGGPSNTLQFRAWDVASGAARETEDNKWNIISDNHFRNRGDGSTYTVRICEDSGCNCASGTCDSSANIAVENEDLIIERNFFSFDTRPVAGSVLLGIEAWGGDQTIRNNVFDYQGAMNAGTTPNRLVSIRGNAHANATNNDNVHVYHNTVYFDDSHSGAFTFCTTWGNGSGLVCRNNLLYAPNNGSFVATAGKLSGGNNVAAATNPFVATLPQQGATSMLNFRIRSPNSGIIDAGRRFTSSVDTNQWVYDDAFGGCRPGPAGVVGAGWDVGAHEFGSAPCQLGAALPPLLPILEP